MPEEITCGEPSRTMPPITDEQFLLWSKKHSTEGNPYSRQRYGEAQCDADLAAHEKAVKESNFERDVRIENLLHGEYWFWQGDGEDHLESLTCQIVIKPEQLKAIVKEIYQKEAEWLESQMNQCIGQEGRFTPEQYEVWKLKIAELKKAGEGK